MIRALNASGSNQLTPLGRKSKSVSVSKKNEDRKEPVGARK